MPLSTQVYKYICGRYWQTSYCGVTLRWNIIPSGGEGGGGGSRNIPSHVMLQTETQQDKCWPDGPRGLCADSTSTSELLFASILDQMIVQNIPYE